MFDTTETCLTIKNYLKKLLQIINNGATFTFFKTKLIERNKLDDVLCCIEASFPEEYYHYIKNKGGTNIICNRKYKELLRTIRNKSLLSSSCYSVKYNEAISLINTISMSLEKDFKYIQNNS